MNSDEYREYIKTEISEIKEDVKNIQATQVIIQIDIARIQTETRIKTAFYGTLGGILPAIGIVIYFVLSIGN